MQDAMLKNDIISALEWEPDIDFGTAGVWVIEGLVTLFGRVGSMPQQGRRRARRPARARRGNRHE